MAQDNNSVPNNNLSSAERALDPAFRDNAEEVASRAVLAGAPIDHSLANEIAARTETPQEAAIDAANGLRGTKGRTPRPEDFDGLLTPEGNSGDIVGSDIGASSVFTFGKDATLGDAAPK